MSALRTDQVRGQLLKLANSKDEFWNVTRDWFTRGYLKLTVNENGKLCIGLTEGGSPGTILILKEMREIERLRSSLQKEGRDATGRV